MLRIQLTVIDIGRAGKEAAHQLVTFAANLAQAGKHLVQRHAEQQHGLRRQHQRAFHHLRHDLGGASRLQLLDIAVIKGPDDDRHLRPQGAHVREDGHRCVRIGKADHHRRGARQAGSGQHLLSRGVAEHHRIACSGRLLDPHRIGIQCDHRDIFLLKEAGQALAGAAIAANDHVAALAHRLDGELLQLDRARFPFAGDQPHDNALAVRQYQWRQHHRNQHRGQHHLHRWLGQGLMSPGKGQQDEAELAGRRQRQPAAQRHRFVVFEAQAEQVNDQEFDRNQADQHQQHQQPPVPHSREVEQHADGDEEQPKQHIAKGLDVVFDLVAILGFRYQHAGQECAQGQRKSGRLGCPGQAQRHQQHRQYEQFRGLLRGNDLEQRPHDALAEYQDDEQHHAGLEQGGADLDRDLFARQRQRRHQHQQRDHRQILEQQHTHDLLAMGRMELCLLGQHLGNDGRRRHGEDAAKHQARLPAQAGESGDDNDREDADQYLQPAEAENQAAHGHQLGQREFEADRKHQEHHAELGQIAGAGGIGHKSQRAGADQHSDQQVAENGRHVHATENHHHHHRRGKQDDYQREGGMVGHGYLNNRRSVHRWFGGMVDITMSTCRVYYNPARLPTPNAH